MEVLQIYARTARNSTNIELGISAVNKTFKQKKPDRLIRLFHYSYNY